jgi:hypothetical protein
VASNASSIGEKAKTGEEIAIFAIFGAHWATKMAIGKHSHIGFATSTKLLILGGLVSTPGVYGFEL